MAITSTNFGKLLEPGLRKVFFESYQEIPEQYSQVFNVGGSKKAVEHDHSVAGFGLFDNFDSNTGASVTYEDILDGYTTDYTHAEFAKGVAVSRKMVDDDQYNVIKKLPQALGRAARATVETNAANVLNNAFDATKPIADGKALCAADHPLNPAAGAATQSNLLTLALSDDAIKQAMILARKQQDMKGLKIQVVPRLLVVPPELEYLAIEITKSAQKAGTADNDINSLMGRLKVVVLDYLTDTNNWFLIDPRVAQLNFFWRVKPEFKLLPETDNLQAKYRAYLRFSVGASDWRGVVGSQVA